MFLGGEKKFFYVFILMFLEREWYILDELFVFVDKKRKKMLYKIIDIKILEDKGIILIIYEEDEVVL